MYLAIREMRFAKARYSLIALIMLMVSFLVLFVNGLAQGLAYDNAASIQNMQATHFVMEQGANQRFTRSLLSSELLAQAEAVLGAASAEPLGIQMATLTPQNTTLKLDVALLAVRPGGWLMPEVTEGAAEVLQGTGRVLVDDSMKESGITIGTILTDHASGRQWTVGGFVRQESFSHAPAVLVSEQDWQQLQQLRSSKGAASLANETSYNAIAVRADEGQARKLAAQLPDAEMVVKSAAIDAIPGYKEEQGSLLMMIVFLYIISAFVLAVFFYVMTIQKSSQFGILKAIGTRASYLARSVALQVLLLAAGSLAISVLLVQVMQAALPEGMPFQLQPSVLLLTCGAFLAISLLGSLLSVWQVSRINALDAIGRTAA